MISSIKASNRHSIYCDEEDQHEVEEFEILRPEVAPNPLKVSRISNPALMEQKGSQGVERKLTEHFSLLKPVIAKNRTASQSEVTNNTAQLVYLNTLYAS
ncbi:hypothetical protein VTN96DRAFT_9505 [Rasamsonia emersonii]